MKSTAKKFYAALVVAAAIATCLEIALGYASAIAIPTIFFDKVSYGFGNLCVNVLTVTVPYFLVSLMLLPLLGFFARGKTFQYAFVTLIGYGILAAWRAPDLVSGTAYLSHTIPLIAGMCSILLTGWIVGRKYLAT